MLPGCKGAWLGDLPFAMLLASRRGVDGRGDMASSTPGQAGRNKMIGMMEMRRGERGGTKGQKKRKGSQVRHAFGF